MGGHYQAVGHSFLLSNMIDFNYSPQHSLDLPRIFPNNGIVEVEQDFDIDVINHLRNLGHKVNYSSTPIGGGQVVLFDEQRKIFIGASDWRKDGVALGI